MAIEELQDADGENQAVRAFLALYGCAGGISVARMQMHMKRSGFRDCWPSWVSDALPEMPLTKGGAQDWIRHLFGLEQQASAKEAPAVVDGLPPLELPRPACTYADHSYPAYSARQVEQIARAYGEECARKAGAGHCQHCTPLDERKQFSSDELEQLRGRIGPAVVDASKGKK